MARAVIYKLRSETFPYRCFLFSYSVEFAENVFSILIFVFSSSLPPTNFYKFSLSRSSLTFPELNELGIVKLNSDMLINENHQPEIEILTISIIN